MKSIGKVLLMLALVVTQQACSKSTYEEEKQPGKCEEHANCQPGTRCVNGWCEDIYHPRKDIKPY